MLTPTESLKAFMQAEGLTQIEIANTLKVPASRVSEWCNFTRNCQRVLILDLWKDTTTGKKMSAFRLPHFGEAQKSVDFPWATDVQMWVGHGIWGIVKLWYFKNQYLQDNQAR